MDESVKNLNTLHEEDGTSSQRNERRHTDSYSSIFKTKAFQKKSRKKLLNSSVSSINSYTQTPLSFKNEDTQSIIIEMTETPVSVNRVDYDTLIPNKCGDLTKLNYVNKLEKYLINRIYSNVNKLSSVLNEMNAVDLDHFLKTPDQNECLPMYYAIKAQCINAIKLLLQKGSTLDKTTKLGDPALHLSCLLGTSLDLIEFLISQSDDLYKTDQEGWCILHCACNQGHVDIVKYLVEKKFMNPNVKDAKTSYTGIQLAAINGKWEVVEYFLSFPSVASVKKNTLPDIDQKNIQDNAKNIIITSDADGQIKKKKQEKITLEPKFLYSVDRNLEPSKNFVYNNFLIDLTSRNNEGQTLLHLACLFGQYEIVNLLLKKYASNLIDVNVCDFKGRTCLDLAWIWLTNLNTSDNKSIFYDSSNSFYVQRKDLINDQKLEREVKIIFLLTKYGAKFSDQKYILYDIEKLKQSEYIDEELISFDEQYMLQMEKIQFKQIISIQSYLRCILHLFKLNMPTLFLKRDDSKNQNFVKISVNEITYSTASSLEQDTLNNFDKIEMLSNLDSLESFINKNVIDTFEKEYYLNQINMAKHYLNNF